MYYIYLDPLDRGNFHTKDKIDQFCQIQDKKELLNGYFHSRTFFFNSRTLPNGFDRFFNAFSTLFECFLNAFWTLFFHSRTSEMSGTAKTTLVFFFPHQPPKSIFFGFGVQKSSIWKLQVLFNLYIYMLLWSFMTGWVTPKRR